MSTGLIANRDAELRFGPMGLRLFSVSGWNKTIRDAGIAAGNYWIGHYGPLRWNASYAMNNLGYRPVNKRHWLQVRAGNRAPFYETGTWQANFNSRARTEAVAKKGGARFWIVCPIGHPIRPETGQQFATLPTRERQAVSREYRRAIIQALQTGRVVEAQKQQAKAQRAATAANNRANRQAQRDRAAASRATRRTSSIKGTP